MIFIAGWLSLPYPFILSYLHLLQKEKNTPDVNNVIMNIDKFFRGGFLLVIFKICLHWYRKLVFALEKAKTKKLNKKKIFYLKKTLVFGRKVFTIIIIATTT